MPYRLQTIKTPCTVCKASSTTGCVGCSIPQCATHHGLCGDCAATELGRHHRAVSGVTTGLEILGIPIAFAVYCLLGAAATTTVVPIMAVAWIAATLGAHRSRQLGVAKAKAALPAAKSSALLGPATECEGCTLAAAACSRCGKTLCAEHSSAGRCRDTRGCWMPRPRRGKPPVGRRPSRFKIIGTTVAQ